MSTTIITISTILLVFLLLTYIAWRRYLWAADATSHDKEDICPYSLTEVFDNNHLINIPHQKGVQWLGDVFTRSARKYPEFTALQIPHSGETLSFAELDARAEQVAAALSPFLTGPDQIVAVAMSQDNWQIIASHLGILRAGGTMMFLDSSLPDSLIEHMLDDAQPVVILTRGQSQFRNLPTLDVLDLPDNLQAVQPPAWLDDPGQRLASIFYTSGTTGMPKGVECHHAGYVNLALTYADYFDLIPGMDATSLTSSLGYDGSISEMYSAWISGCAVVMLTKEQVRSGPDLLPVLCEAEVTVLFCPPVLLTTLTPNPELDLPYPLCRYIVPAGEAFPNALVEPWTRARRQIINTYGPTEASTDTSRQSLRPGEAITIGSPLANVSYIILEIDQLTPLPHGETGELCIGGVHVARGYRNLPEQTARTFIDHPEFGRLYRTGDRCKIDRQTQRVHFLGRVDSQLKVRGHRVETQAVEDILQNQFSEIEAAVLDYQNQELLAFVTAPSLKDLNQSKHTNSKDIKTCLAPIQWSKQVIITLTKQLPEPSIPTRIFLVDKFVMKATSGKIDRRCLPKLSALPDTNRMETKRKNDFTQETNTEPASDEVLQICQSIFENKLGWDDDFAEHGGHSIAIAQLALRLQDAGWQISVRALLSNCNTARKIAEQPREYQQTESTANAVDKPVVNHSKYDKAAARVLSVSWFTTLQVLFLSLLYAPHLTGFIMLVSTSEIGHFFMTANLGEFISLGLQMYLLALLLPFASLLWVMLIKYFMGGDVYKNNITPGTYSKWSRMHLRIWCIGRLENSVLHLLTTLYRSASLITFVLRQLGAKVGKNLQCADGVEFSGPLDQLNIKNDVTIQTGAYLQPTRWSDQEFQVGPIKLESRCKIGMRSSVSCNVTIGHGSWITPFTPILEDVPAKQIWEGSPARFSGKNTTLKRTANHCRYSYPYWLLELRNILMQSFLDFWLFIVPTAMVSWFALFFVPGSDTEIAGDYFQLTPLYEIIWQMGLYAFFTTWMTVVLVSLIISVFLRYTATSPGLYPTLGIRGTLLMYRIKKMNQIQSQWTWTITGQYLRALAGMHFPRTGSSECDLMFNIVPELVSADSQVFWSNGSYSNMLDYGAEHIKLSRLDMPRNFFSGTNCVIDSGQFPSNFLLGVSTPGNDIQFRRQMRSRPGKPITVAGNPPIKFASARFDTENETHKLPTFPLFLARVFLNDILSIGILPIASTLIYVILYTSLLRLDLPLAVSAIIALTLAEFVLIAGCIIIKKIIVGNWGSAHSTPFWSWRHFAYFFAQDCFFAWCKIPLSVTAGTVLSNNILRRMGCKIGKRTIISSPMQASDWNAVNFGDDCIVNGFLQLHTFENMQLKVKRTHIQDGSTINTGATVMGGVVIQPGSTLLPLSMALKEMNLSSAIYEGSPAEPVSIGSAFSDK